MSSYDALDLIALKWCLAMLVLLGLLQLLTAIPQRRSVNRRRRMPIVRRLLNRLGTWCQRRRERAIRLPAKSSDVARCERTADWRSQAFNSRYGDPL